MDREARTLDLHVAGEPLRLVTAGAPAVPGATMTDKLHWAEIHLDRLRRALLWEPRGHADMYGAVLTEPTTPTAHAGVLFMHQTGFSALCGHGLIAVTTALLERELLHLSGGDATDDAVELRLDTPAGPVSVRAERRGRRVGRVSYLSVPSFVSTAGLLVAIADRHVPVDVAFGGGFYAIVDGEAAGVRLTAEALPSLRRLGLEIRSAVSSRVRPVHPADEGVTGVSATIFTGPALGDADLRQVAVFGEGQVDRSPSGTGTAAVMAVLDAMGLLGDARGFVAESLLGTRLRGSVASRTTVGDQPALVARIEGQAWITGDHTFVFAEDDPLGDGVAL